MRVRGKNRRFMRKVNNFLAECQTAGRGIIMATKNWKFLVVAILSFLVFGTLLSLLSGGTAGFKLLITTGSLSILGKAFLGLFGVGRTFIDWAVVFFISLLQGVLIGLVALVWKKRKKSAKPNTKSNAKAIKSGQKSQKSAKSTNSDNLQSTGLIAGLAILGTGCPTCGTTLITPVIGAIMGSGGLAIAGTISGVLTLLAVIISFFALKRMGNEAYAIMIEEEFKEV